jgi:predicted ABC-class ATPase
MTSCLSGHTIEGGVILRKVKLIILVDCRNSAYFSYSLHSATDPGTKSVMYHNSRSRGGGRGGGGGGGGGGGRGEYYKNKYGGGGGRARGGGYRNDSGGNTTSDSNRDRPATGGGSYSDLRHLLQRLDGKSYPAYHDLDTTMDRGWVNPQLGFTLYVERAQSDPYAAPTRCRVVVDSSTAGFPHGLYANRVRSVGLGDYLLRSLYQVCRRLGADSSMGNNNSGGGNGSGAWSGPKGGDLQVLPPCQHVLEQSAVRVDAHGNVIAQITINLPARGRTILGQAAEQILCHTLPTMVEQSLMYSAHSEGQIRQHVECVEDQVWLQGQLEVRNLVAFVRNGAILPRLSGADDRPMASGRAIAFKSPERLEISVTLPNARTTVTGMGIPKGITLICGGGFHGKSTLLETLQVGVYPKIPGDGREFCVTSFDACKIRAEDGRFVQSVDISNFINNLPFGKDTTCFSSLDASGSTSQSTSIIEVSSLEGWALLLGSSVCRRTNVD